MLEAALTLLALVCVAPKVVGEAVNQVKEVDAPLPIVTAVGVPSYPAEARLGKIEGAAVLRVRTDGQKVWVANHVSGSPILLRAAEENVKTWRFKAHRPTGFLVTYRYQLKGQPAVMSSETERNPTVLFRLPSEVEVVATGLMAVFKQEEPRH